MTFSLNENTINILYKDLLNIIQDYKNSAESFEEHSKITININDELSRIFKIIQTNEDEHHFKIVNINYGDYILEYIEEQYYINNIEEYGFDIDYGL